MHKNLAFIIFTIALVCSCGAEQNIKKGEKFLAIGEYHNAAEQFKQAYQRIPPKERERRGKYALKTAQCYAKINAAQKSAAAYRNAFRYKQGDISDKLDFARQLLKTGEYKAAYSEFQLILDSIPDSQLAASGLQSAQQAPKWKQENSRYTVKRMEIFNSRRADFSPVLTGDQFDKLYFTSTRNEAQGDDINGITGMKNGDIFVSEKDDKGKWGKPKPAEGGINTHDDEGACSFSADQREMYLTVCTTNADAPRYAQIAVSSRADAAWSKANPIRLTRDSLSSYAHPVVSPDGQWLYFVSDMPGGMGGLDIWRVRIVAGDYGGVENLGEPINTPGDEMFPTFRPNGDLYFSSNGHPGMGGLDIFIARMGKDRRIHIEHPGYPLNSQGDDFGMTFEGARNRGFFASNRGDGKGWDHIYSFENPEIIQTIKGWVYELGGYELPASQVYLIGSDGTNLKLSVKGDGSFEQVVNPNVDYLLMATCKGFLNHQVEMHIDPSDESQEHVIQFPLASIAAPVLIDNIFYDFNKETLRPESTKALDELVEMLNQNPNITIELSAHCDYKGAAEYNKTLSQRRAESVVKYLIEHGIAKDRLTPMGYGKEKPKHVRGKQAKKYEWLKEGTLLSEEFIKTLKEEQQEICNQMNRRTEFTVLRTTYGMFDDKGQLQKPPKTKTKEPKGELGEEEFEILLD